MDTVITVSTGPNLHSFFQYSQVCPRDCQADALWEFTGKTSFLMVPVTIQTGDREVEGGAQFILSFQPEMAMEETLFALLGKLVCVEPPQRVNSGSQELSLVEKMVCGVEALINL